MIEKREPVTVERVRAFCLCGGEMKSGGPAQLTVPPRYLLKCSDCDAVQWSTKTYPYVDIAPRLTFMSTRLQSIVGLVRGVLSIFKRRF
jgi:hypothetical protein